MAEAIPGVGDILNALGKGGALTVCGVSGAAAAWFVAAMHARFPGRDMVVVLEGNRAQETFHSDVETWLRLLATPKTGSRSGDPPPEGDVAGPASAAFFPSWEVLPHEDRLPHLDVISERLETLLRLAGQVGDPRAGEVVVTTGVALLQGSWSPKELAERTRRLVRNDEMDPLGLMEWLEDQGYEPESQVTAKGEFSWRGGIVDAWPVHSPWPVRVEFFGNTVESIREFDPHGQRSRGTIDRAILPPAGELGLLRRLHAERLGAGGGARPVATLLDHLKPGAMVVVVEPSEVGEVCARYEEGLPAMDSFHVRWSGLAGGWTAGEPVSVWLGLTEGGEAEADGSVAGVELPTLESYRPLVASLPSPEIAELQRGGFFRQLHRWLRQGYRIDVFCGTEGERQRFGELWSEYGCDAGGGGGGLESPGMAVRSGLLSRGFLAEAGRWVVVSDAEVFGRYKQSRPRRLKGPQAAAVRSAFEIDFTEFEEGDFVVHLQHGIGRYRGLKTLVSHRAGAGPVAGDAGQECLVIEFGAREPGDEPPRLYVPVSEAHLVSKYVGAGKARPPLSLLGGTRWRKAKEEAERSVRDLASELLGIQAARSLQPGHAFGGDTAWQREFEGSFPHEETPDQVRAIAAVKEDMEKARPMDRLICGDVGFGKTEVALRAAFKAVMGGKQVAVLVPTTVLAQQHYHSFRERMEEFPVRVEVLSRMRRPSEIRAVLAAVASGQVDVVIGTHRLVQDDVVFKDLGLVIVDEEQKFGVMHKERFKFLRRTVDVLTLSATPIPRTLHLALTGVRDMSTLETPPQDRLPVETAVGPYDERVIRDAILRELGRGGQVFYLHNRVTTIDAVAVRLRALVPDARVAIGHGQMESRELEEAMTGFVNGEADVLLCTTIIESGLDIPNANTIIIDRADRFGLSELYQLRGRVGRYKHQAYAYLLLPRHARLLTEARKRMSAIRQYSSLGSGFRIAMRDLELRGAGNLLGAQQSGHITAVGFDLYCRLLARSVAALKGEPTRATAESRVRLDFIAEHPGEEVARETGGARSPAFLPLDFVREPAQRVELYRKLAVVSSREDVSRLRAEMQDRFGPPPAAVDLMLGVAELRVLAAERRVTVVEVEEGKVKLTRNGELITVGGRFPRLTRKDSKARLGEIRKLLLSLQ